MNFNWDENPDLNITPMVDIMLVLMAILMVTAPIMEYQDDISLPQGSTVKATHKVADLTVYIDDKKIMRINKTKCDFINFDDTFQLESRKYPKGTVVYIRANENLQYKDVMHLFKVIKDSGFTKVSLVTDGG